MLQLDIVEVDRGERYQVLDARGHLMGDWPTKREAVAFAAGYKAGRYDAAQIVRVQAEQLAKVAG